MNEQGGRNQPRPQGDQSDAECGQFHLIITGPTGSGKSSLGNQLVGRSLFPVEHNSPGAVTLNFKKESACRFECHFSVEDTPGAIRPDTIPFNEEVMRKVAHKCKRHVDETGCETAILFCVKLGARYAEEEHRAYRELKRAWRDKGDFCRRLVVAFTHGDSEGWQKYVSMKTQEADRRSEGSGPTPRREMPVEEQVLEAELWCNEWTLMKEPNTDADGRYVFFKNKEGTSDERAVQRLFEMLKNMDLQPTSVSTQF